MTSAPEIAVIGGGTGSFTLLQNLKEFTPNITAIVNMSDDGGSTGILRDELGVLPPGDIRQCLVALSGHPKAREMFTYRYKNGPAEGHPIGNMILAGLEEMHDGDFEQAITVASELLQVTGKVVPVTLEEHRLVMFDGRHMIIGENNIGDHHFESPDARISLVPKAPINPRAEQAIASADMVVIAPGNLYRSLLPALAVDGMKEALSETAAKKVMITNLVNLPGQTAGWHVADYVRKVETYIGEGQIDSVIYNTEPPTEELLEKYAAEGEHPPCSDEEGFEQTRARVIGACLLSNEVYVQDANEKFIRRTLIRHDANHVGRLLMRLCYEEAITR